MTVAFNSNFDKTNPFSDTCAQFGLSVNLEQIFTVPGTAINKYKATFEYNATSNIFVCLNATPVIPALGSVGTQQYNEFRPTTRYVQGGDVIHMITPDAAGAYAGVFLMALPG